ncbi:EAL domain-containing protein [Cupriavidus sp. UME77]|uniref:EAL domain-containing protein n=1 Tax=Cupriavidus sp. UME77 TaxID=1862321 RepID=UPI001DCDF4D6|nr:EAL domain-containing protein [Cupriavidus sp. UME77]MBB1633553.1 diguanylate phosphodiesterase [Cupriavidus sp. UME77]
MKRWLRGEAGSVGARRPALLAALLATGLALWLVVMLAAHDARERVERMSSAVRDNLELALADTLDIAYQDRALVGAPCRGVARQLQEQGAYTAYIRDVVLVARGMRYCSAVRGEIATPLGELLNWQPGLQYLLAKPPRGGSMALAVFLGTAPGGGVLVWVEGRYLADMVQSAGKLGFPGIEIEVAGTRFMLNGGVGGVGGELGGAGEHAGAPALVRRDDAGQGAHGIVDIRPLTGHPITVIASAPHSLVLNECLKYMVLPPLAAGIAALVVLGLHSRRAARRSFAAELQRGLRNGEFVPYYQPVVDLESGLCTGLEVLARWAHPRRGLLEPEHFIQAIEQQHLAVALTLHLIPRVLRDLEPLALPPAFHLAFNVTSEHFDDAGFWAEDSPLFALLRANVTPVLEITERDAVSLVEHQRSAIQRAKARGIKLAVDDFGTGYCGLAYFKQFEVDFLKLDRIFVQADPGDKVSGQIVDVTINFAHALDLAVVAEGIECEAQRAWLAGKGVRLGQGYHFARPLTRDGLCEWLPAHLERGVPAALPGGSLGVPECV